MHPIVTFAVLSWIIALSIYAVTSNAVSILLGQLTYREGCPAITLAFMCLAIAIESFAAALDQSN